MSGTFNVLPYAQGLTTHELADDDECGALALLTCRAGAEQPEERAPAPAPVPVPVPPVPAAAVRGCVSRASVVLA